MTARQVVSEAASIINKPATNMKAAITQSSIMRSPRRAHTGLDSLAFELHSGFRQGILLGRQRAAERGRIETGTNRNLTFPEPRGGNRKLRSISQCLRL